MKKPEYFVVDKQTRDAVSEAFPSFAKAKEYQIRQNLIGSTDIWGFDPKDMTEDVADKNGVVAAMCCMHCSHFWSDSNKSGITNAVGGTCNKLDCRTYITDVCKHYHGNNEN